MSDRTELHRDRLSVLLAGSAVGFALSRVIELPGQHFAVRALGSPLGIELTTYWLTTVFVVGLVVTGTHSLLLSHPLCRECPARSTVIFWILPGLTALVVGASLRPIEDVQNWLLALVGGLIALGIVTTHEYRALAPEVLTRPGAQLLGTVMVYSLASALFYLVYRTGARFLLSGPAVLLVAWLLAVRLFWHSGQPPRRIALYGGVVGLIMSQAVWALGYWRVQVLGGALLLLLIFYLATGLVQESLQNQPGRQALIELAATALLAAVIVALA